MKPEKACADRSQKPEWCFSRGCAHPDTCVINKQDREASKRMSGNSGDIDDYLNEVTGGAVGND